MHLTKKGLSVVHDETLHIPHNSSAYSRSRTTANKLLQNGANAIFDIHRDGASRSFYLTEKYIEKKEKVPVPPPAFLSIKDKNLIKEIQKKEKNFSILKQYRSKMPYNLTLLFSGLNFFNSILRII
mgnify:CR=1 FL=1